MKRRLTRIGNSWGLIIPKEVLDLLEIEPPDVDVQLVGNTLVVSPPDISPEEVEASLAYIASKNERAEAYRRLAN